MAEMLGTTVRAPKYYISTWFSITNPNPNPNPNLPNNPAPSSDDEVQDENVFFTHLDKNQQDIDQDHNVINNNGLTIEDNDFWLSLKHKLLDSLRRSSKLETEIRKIANQIVINSSETRFCSCVETKAANCCRKCVLSQISDGLGKQGYNASLCKSTSRSSDQFLFGEHKFVDVVENIGKNRTKEVRVIIEINLRSEFEMSSGLVSTEEYKELVQLLPELYIGKAERLDMVINIMCLAAKMCMKHNNMHLAPWRTYQYMCAKWLGPYKRDNKTSNNTSQKRVSMLTLDLQNMLPNNPLAV
ncbi:hypothetical protein G4B88_026562 [Cannabis sativa]|uniref:Uncharacterized protein n=1 Tax=Cannabis sativa TaxID=3483 RepID=A0A7J6GT91_CANSA|nr:hypothetical protein G4B88_026562 [Cannabis sativa]